MPNKNRMFSGFDRSYLKLFKKMNTPSKIQDFLNTLKTNFEEQGDSLMSPLSVLKTGKAHCIEGALLAAAILRYHGQKPLIVDMEATTDDFDHVIAVFKKDGCWGALAKTNHAVLRYREPVYKTIRELVMSYFHEYFMNSTGAKTLRTYSKPVDMTRFDKQQWMTSDKDMWFLDDYLVALKHIPILTRKQIRGLRKADPIEIQAGEIVEYADPSKSKAL